MADFIELHGEMWCYLNIWELFRSLQWQLFATQKLPYTKERYAVAPDMQSLFPQAGIESFVNY